MGASGNPIDQFAKNHFVPKDKSCRYTFIVTTTHPEQPHLDQI